MREQPAWVRALVPSNLGGAPLGALSRPALTSLLGKAGRPQKDLQKHCREPRGGGHCDRQPCQTLFLTPEQGPLCSGHGSELRSQQRTRQQLTQFS